MRQLLGGVCNKWAMLPPLLLPVSTGVPLRGVVRRGGRVSDAEGATGVRQRPGAASAAQDGAARLTAVAAQLRGPSSAAASLARRWQTAVRTVMANKVARYERERSSLQAEVDDAQAKAAAFVHQARSGGADALADDQTSSWEVAKEVNSRWQSLVAQAAALDRIILTARIRSDEINNAADFASLRVELAAAIERLVADYSMQSVLMETIADLIDGFVNQPLVAAQAMLNFVLMGRAGAGKSRLATTLAAVVGKLGLFAYDQLVEAGRSDFVAEYEGQTATKARSFLMSNLEKVIFLDEAYSLTTWELKGGTRTLSAYSAEAATELVAFLSQRVGATCFLAAGYEHEMLADFLPANAGLPRRFPYRVWLHDYTAAQLVNIYLGALAEALSDPPPAQQLTAAVVRSYFTGPALAFLLDLLEAVRASTGTAAMAEYPLLKQAFAAQAGAMVTLANTTGVLIASSTDHSRIGLNDMGQDTWAIGLVDMNNILTTLLQQQFGPHATKATDEVLHLAAQDGWYANGAWQVPGNAAPSRPRKRR